MVVVNYFRNVRMVCQFFLEKQTIFTMQETARPTFIDNEIQTLIQSASWTESVQQPKYTTGMHKATDITASRCMT